MTDRPATLQPDDANRYLLHDSLGYLLFRLSKGLQLVFEKQVQPFGLNAPQWGILNACYQGQGYTPSALATLLAVDNAAVTRQVQILLRKGWITVEKHPSDRRSYTITLTESGKTTVEAIIPISRQLNQTLFSSLTEHEKQQFVHFIETLLQANQLL